MKVTLVIECAGQNLSSQIIGQKMQVEFKDGTKFTGYLTEAQIEHDPYPPNYWDSVHMNSKSYYKALLTGVKPKILGSSPTPNGSEVGQVDTLNVLYEAIPGIQDIRAICPSGSCGYPAQLTEMIVHLNDYHTWPREKIADWLEEAGLALPITMEGNE